MLIFLLIVALLSITVFLFIQQPSFGEIPEGKRLEKIKTSSNYVNGRFKNLSPTSLMADQASYIKLLKLQFWKETPTEPATVLPSVKSDLAPTLTEKPVITWFGHSSLLIQLKEKNILVDPVLSERASPVQYAGSRNYEGTSIFTTEDLPTIDYVLITHDHYDHLDYGTITQLKSRKPKFYTPLGVGAHLESWGIPSEDIHEFDWWESENIDTGIKLITTPARHFSGRSLTDKNKTLWASFVLITQEHNIYLGGDSGYDTHFREIGEKYGPFDIAILEAGQYHEYWPNIHMMPEETVQASKDLKAKVLLPVHWGKFTLSLHRWDDPIVRINNQSQRAGVQITTPRIGEKIILDSIYPESKWWVGI